MDLRFLYIFALIIAFATGIGVVVTYIDHMEAQQTSSPVSPTQTPTPSPQPGTAVSVTDDAQQQTPGARPDTPEPSRTTHSTQEPAYDRKALDAQVDQTLRGTLDPTPVQKTEPQPTASPAEAAPAAAHPAPLPAPPAPAAQSTTPLEKKIGQMLIFGFQGSAPEQKWPMAVARQLQSGELGGVIFLGYNLKNRADARRLMKYFRAAGGKAALPPFFVLDQEGGRVQRLGPKVGVQQWPSHAAVARRSLEAARTRYDQMASVLRDWGFNVNLGPVTDVNIHPANPIIGKLGRSFSSDPAKVSAFARTFIDAHRQKGIITSLKHFPGHGSSQKDSHLGFVDITRSWKKSDELRPYRELIGAGRADMVMIGHLYLAQFQSADSPQKYPATLSPEIVTGLLRNELGYRGVVISDDMEMGAIRKLYSTYEAAIRAIKAGVDLLIVSNSAKPEIGLPGKYIAEIAGAARRDPELRARIEESYSRIRLLKQRLVPRKAQAPHPHVCASGNPAFRPFSSTSDSCQYSRTATPAKPTDRKDSGRPALVPPADARG